MQKAAIFFKNGQGSYQCCLEHQPGKGLQIETHGWAMCYTQDQVEGMTAFIEKKTQLYRKISDKINEVKLAKYKREDVQASLSWFK